MYLCYNREAIDKITEELLEKETLNGDEFRTILAQYATIPEENIKAVQEQFEAKQAITV
jgi:cell division protease FtsH